MKEDKLIACCSVLYKIISKVLAKRLQDVMATIICDGQARFISGRKISDNIILVHELVKAYTRKNVSPRSMLKIDLQKVYDPIEWPYLEEMMKELGFPYMFTQWVIACVKSVSYAIIMNVIAIQPFAAAKGLRQGDPMSPFLFSIAMKYLSRSLNSLHTMKTFKYHPKIC